MKKTKLLGLALISTMTSFFACTNETEEAFIQNCEIKLTSKIAPTSRVNSLDYQSTQIVEGQQVGVTIIGAQSEHNNVAWSVGSYGTLVNTSNPIYWGDGNATITAYHPFNSTWTDTDQSFSVSTDQSNEVEYLNSDLLWASSISPKTNEAVALTFLHKLAKINVSLICNDIADLEGATISICGTNIITIFNPSTGVLSETAINIQDIKAGIITSTTNTASAIIIPQTMTGGTQFIKVEHNGKNYYYTLTEDKELKSGYSYSYIFTIKGESMELEIRSDNIIDWNNETIEGEIEEEILEIALDVSTAGTLSSLITEQEKYSIKTLKISGLINGDDVRYIREMAGFDADGNETKGKLTHLDLRNANIVAGGGAYLNYGAYFWGFEYEDEGNKAGQWISETTYTHDNNSSYMFIGLKQLEQLILPNSLVNLGNMTFYGCHKLKTITLPASVDYSLSYSQHFHACLALETIEVEEGNPYLFSRDGVLYGNNGGIITLLAIPASRKAFTIQSDIDYIESYAIPLGSSLEELTITENAPELNPYFYDNLFCLKNFIVDANNQRYTTIDGVLYSKDLTTIECYPSGRTTSTYEIPDGITAIGDGCFNTSWYLSEIIIPEGVETIGRSAFFYCYNLHEIILPSTVNYINESAFQHLHLYQLTCKAVNPPTLFDQYVFSGNYEKIMVPAESVELYKEADVWKDYADVIYPIGSATTGSGNGSGDDYSGGWG